MARATSKEKDQTELLWDEYLAAQLTPEEQADAYREAERRCEEARRAGVYDCALEIVGKVKWSISWQSLRLEERS